jgi:hypothetical protein
MNISNEHGSGSHDPYDLASQEHTCSGSFTCEFYLMNGANASVRAKLLALTRSLMNQADEGLAVYFDIYIIAVHNRGSGQPDA